MAGQPARSIPWCTLFLVACATTCQVCVLVGNYQTASAMEELGESTGGWSRVGLGIARSLKTELDGKMQNVSTMLLDGLKHVTVVQDSLDGFLSMVGDKTDEAIGQSKELSLLQREGPKGLALLQVQQDQAAGNATGNVSQVLASLTPMIMSAVHNALQTVMDKVTSVLHLLMEKLRPALDQVAEWVHKFGGKIQAGISEFSGSVDKVQKLFDQVMKQLNRGSPDEALEAEMLKQTFGLFDMSNTGKVSAEDLHQVADLYHISSMHGELPEKLVSKYDADGDSELDEAEMAKFVNDPAIPGSMPVLLRTYSKRLAEAGGNVAAARMRDEVAKAVVQYFSIVCAKNMTKVGWVAERLGNRSLPLAFTGDVMIQLCLSEDDPNKMTTTSVGKLVIGEMYKLHPRNTLNVLDMLSNTTYWDSEGFDVHDQPRCVEKVTKWVTQAESLVQACAANDLQHPSLMELSVAFGHKAAVDQVALQALPAVAARQAKESVAVFQMDKLRREEERHRSFFKTSTHELLLQRLTGGLSVRAATKGSGAVERATKSGIHARPETLEFARWLSYNVTATVKLRQSQCFEYSSDSSSAVDSVATQIEAMVTQVKGFIDMMMKYASPAGIDRLEKTIEEFAEHGMKEVIEVVEHKLVSLLNHSAPELEKAVRHAAHVAGEDLGRRIGEALGSPMGEALVPAVKTVVKSVSNNSAAQDLIGDQLSNELGKVVSDFTGKAVEKQAGKLVDELVDKALSGGADLTADLVGKINDKFGEPSLIQTVDGLYHGHTARRLHAQVEAFESDDVDEILAAVEVRAGRRGNPLEAVGGAVAHAWQGLIKLLKALVNLVPSATSTLKFAKEQVSKLSSNLDSVFGTFEDKGPPLFQNIASIYRVIWIAYFFVIVPLNLAVVYYAFWAGGYCGGPQPIDEASEQSESRTFREKCALCCKCCGSCLQNFHDTSLCFWSVTVLAQLFVLIMFVVSIVLCILSGVQALLLSGCSEVYLLADDTICAEALGTVRAFLDTFFVSSEAVPLGEVCKQDFLLTCDLIQSKMASSTILTTVFSILAALLTMQLIVDSATLHEQATWRRKAHAMWLKEAAGVPDQASGSTM